MPAHEPRTRPLARLAMAAAAIGLFLVAYFWGNQYRRDHSKPPEIAGVLVRPARAIPGFELQDTAGQSFTAEHFAEHWTLLSFGNPSQAPGHLALTRLIEVRNRLGSDPSLQGLLQFTLLARQQDPTLAPDLAYLSPALKLLSGSAGTIQRLRASLGALPQEASGKPTEALPIYLIGPSGRLLALFPGAQEPAAIAADLSAIAEHFDTLFPADD